MRSVLRNSIVLLTFIAGFMTVSCEDEISPNLESAQSIVVIDAWINNKPEDQHIKITSTQSYFDNSLPPGISGASVVVTDDLGTDYVFTEDSGSPGNYIWTSSGTSVLGSVGRVFTLSVQIGNESFSASSKMNRVPIIDSLTFTFED